MKNLAIFASGSGSNTEEIIKFFLNSKDINVKLILSNNKKAFVLHRAVKYNIDTLVFNKTELYNTAKIVNALKNFNIDFIILAGFLLLVPENILVNYKQKIINIHPALLPNYGGKGMYGDNVHKAVIKNQEKESGITVHYVNKNYDEGAIIFQEKCPVYQDDTSEKLAMRIHELEHKFYPQIIESVVLKK